jgi:hypothetical protein
MLQPRNKKKATVRILTVPPRFAQPAFERSSLLNADVGTPYLYYVVQVRSQFVCMICGWTAY